MKNFIVICLLSLFSQFSQATPIFKITKEYGHPGLRVVNVEVPKRISESEVEEIARKIYLPGFDLTSIHFSLKSNSLPKTWAVANFYPDLFISIPLEIEKEFTVSELRNFTPPHRGEKIGSWFDEAGDLSMLLMILRSPDGKFLAHSYFRDGSNGKEPLLVKTVNHQVRYYIQKNNMNAYYTLGADGSLQHWNDRDGMYQRFEPVSP